MNKKIISIAVIMALPFTAHATQTIVTTNTPAAVGANGTVNMAATGGPYQTVGITPSTDGAHIASTAYVKGAYNDAIAAVNKLDADKQGKLYNFVTEIADVMGASAIATEVQEITSAILETGVPVSDIVPQLDGYDASFIPGADGMLTAVALGTGAVKDYVDTELGGLTTALDNKRVEAYTTWGANTTAEIAFVTASGN